MSERTNSDTTDPEHPSAVDEQTEAAYVKETQKYERAPEDFQADVSEEDLQVPDHPVLVEPKGYGQASAYLASWGLVEDLQQNTGDEIAMNAEKVAEILRNHYVSPNFETLDAAGVRTMHIDVPDKYLGAIMPGMETEMNADGSATVQTEGK